MFIVQANPVGQFVMISLVMWLTRMHLCQNNRFANQVEKIQYKDNYSDGVKDEVIRPGFGHFLSDFRNYHSE